MAYPYVLIEYINHLLTTLLKSTLVWTVNYFPGWQRARWDLSLHFPTLLFRLIVVCPNHIEFCVNSCCRCVGLLFCPYHDRTWQKWFSTPSSLTSAGLMTAEGNWAVFMATMDLNPRHIDCKSNQSLDDTKLLLSSKVSFLQSTINW